MRFYIIKLCNKEKSPESMHITAATISLWKTRQILVRLIKLEEIEYRGRHLSAHAPASLQIRALKKDWRKNGAKYVFSMIDYGEIACIAAGKLY